MQLLLFYFLLTTFSSWQAFADRHLISEVNPGCNIPECKDNKNGSVNLIHTRSIGDNDTLHHLWSTVGDAPSLLIAQTSKTANLIVDWDGLKEANKTVAVSFTEKPSYAFGVVIGKLMEFNDPSDEGTLGPDSDHVTVVDIKEFQWQDANGSTFSNDGLHSLATFHTVLNTSDVFLREEGGYLAIQLETQGNEGRYEKIPRLLFTPDSTQIRIILENAAVHFEKPRFAVELTLFLTEDSPTNSQPLHIETLKSMDDEYTPGVFKSVHVLSQTSQNNHFGGFLNWKPVVYTSDELSVTGSTEAVHYDPATTDMASVTEETMVKLFFQNLSDPEILTVMKMNVSFGTSQDGFYNNSNYAEWTFSFGLGVPKTDKLSTLVMVVLGTGLGLPLLLIVFSSVYLAYHKMKMQKDDLHLSRR